MESEWVSEKSDAVIVVKLPLIIIVFKWAVISYKAETYTPLSFFRRLQHASRYVTLICLHSVAKMQHKSSFYKIHHLHAQCAPHNNFLSTIKCHFYCITLHDVHRVVNTHIQLWDYNWLSSKLMNTHAALLFALCTEKFHTQKKYAI